MADIEADIKPSGLNQADEVDLMYQLMNSIKGICTKLDADGGVPLTTYVANCYTAIFNGAIYDSQDNSLINRVSTADDRFYIISPGGLTKKARLEWMYQFLDMLETLTEQLDTDGLTGSDFESLCYTALMTYKVTNCKGSTLGNGTTFYFNPGGSMDQKHLVDFYYKAIDAIETLTEKLDADGTVTDTNYEALWFTAKILKKVQNSAGNILGN